MKMQPSGRRKVLLVAAATLVTALGGVGLAGAAQAGGPSTPPTVNTPLSGPAVETTVVDAGGITLAPTCGDPTVQKPTLVEVAGAELSGHVRPGTATEIGPVCDDGSVSLSPVPGARAPKHVRPGEATEIGAVPQTAGKTGVTE